jgi:hypothetical protein
MTTFNIEENKGVWFDMPGGGRVKLRTLSVLDLRKIKKATTTKTPFVTEVNGKTVVLTHEVDDDDLWMSMANDCCVVEWENLFDKNGNPIPCTKENKDILMCMGDGTFRDFVKEKMDILSAHEKEEQAASEKN